MFPNVMKLILKMKQNDYRDLAVRLQRLEAECIIDGVLKKFMDKYENCFIASVHDSIIIKKEFEISK